MGNGNSQKLQEKPSRKISTNAQNLHDATGISGVTTASEIHKRAQEVDSHDFHKRFSLSRTALGDGHESIVREAYDTLFKRKVAVKTILMDKITPKDAAAIRQEIDILEVLDHPHIIKCYEVFHEGDYLHLILERAELGDLCGLIRREGMLSESEAFFIIAQVLLALLYLHKEKRLIHCDIKLENVVLCKDRMVKLIDFGTAASIPDCNSLVKEDEIKGTLMYLAPECWEGLYLPASDMWAVGVMLCEMLFFMPPFSGSTKEELKSQLHAVSEKGNLNFLAKLFAVRQVSEECKDFLFQLFQIAPEKRTTAEKARQHPWIIKNCFKRKPSL